MYIHAMPPTKMLGSPVWVLYLLYLPLFTLISSLLSLSCTHTIKLFISFSEQANGHKAINPISNWPSNQVFGC